jgi:hypothetical protein
MNWQTHVPNMMLKNSRTPLSEKLQKMCGQKQKNMWSKLKKEYCKENCIDRSVIETIIIDFCDDDSDDDMG